MLSDKLMMGGMWLAMAGSPAPIVDHVIKICNGAPFSDMEAGPISYIGTATMLTGALTVGASYLIQKYQIGSTNQ